MNELFATGDMLSTVLKDVFTDVNIYDNDIRLLQYPFISPISVSYTHLLILLQVSFKDTVRLNTRFSGVESLSTLK